jgi:hypothetical protein
MASRYSNLTITSGSIGRRYFVNAVYPTIPASEQDNYIIVSSTDRLDLIAFDFYGDPSLWWIIATANDLDGSSLFPPTGMQIRVPANYTAIVTSFEALNTSR